jgi:hypothetical protein
MQRGLVHVLAWVLATGAAVALSWYGVRTVLTGTAYEPPRALPIAGGGRPSADAWSSSTHRPKPPSPSAASPSAPASRSSSPSSSASHQPDGPAERSPTPTRPQRPEQPEETGSVRSYPVTGGQVVFDFHDTWADLVSATPASGWQMQVWKQTKWIRVDFVSGSDTTSVFCTWHDRPPRVQVDES